MSTSDGGGPGEDHVLPVAERPHGGRGPDHSRDVRAPRAPVDGWTRPVRSPLLAEVLAERWTLAVLGELAGGARTFDDLRAALDGVPATTLASALAQGERDGLLAARRAPGSAETDAWYRVTELGRSLDHSLAALDNWIEVCGVSVEAARKRWDEAPR